MMHVLAKIALVFALPPLLLLTAVFTLRPAQPQPLLSSVYIDNVSVFQLRDLQANQRFLLPDLPIYYTYQWLGDTGQLAYRDDSEGSSEYRVYDLLTGQHHPYISRGFPFWSPDYQWVLDLFPASTQIVSMQDIALSNTLPPLEQVLWLLDSSGFYGLDDENLLLFSVDCAINQTPCTGEVLEGRDMQEFAGMSPDGDIMGIVGEPGGTNNLYMLDGETGERELLLENALPGVVPVWSPNGEVLAATLVQSLGEEGVLANEVIPSLYLIDGTTGEQTLIITGIAAQFHWTSDSQRLTFELVSRVDNSRSVWLYDRSTGQLTTTTPLGVTEISPAWVTFYGLQFDLWVLVVVIIGLCVALWGVFRRKNA